MSEGSAAADGSAPLSFSYTRSIAPLLWTLVAIAMIEPFVVHLVIALLWSQLVAALLSLATAASLIWLVFLIRSFKSHPVLVGEEEVLMRVGRFRSLRVPRERIAGVETAFPPGFVRAPGVLNLALFAHPNVALHLSEPLAGLRRRGAPVLYVAHRLDEPAAFVAALRRP